MDVAPFLKGKRNGGKRDEPLEGSTSPRTYSRHSPGTRMNQRALAKDQRDRQEAADCSVGIPTHARAPKHKLVRYASGELDLAPYRKVGGGVVSVEQVHVPLRVCRSWKRRTLKFCEYLDEQGILPNDEDGRRLDRIQSDAGWSLVSGVRVSCGYACWSRPGHRSDRY